MIPTPDPFISGYSNTRYPWVTNTRGYQLSIMNLIREYPRAQVFLPSLIKTVRGLISLTTFACILPYFWVNSVICCVNNLFWARIASKVLTSNTPPFLFWRSNCIFTILFAISSRVSKASFGVFKLNDHPLAASKIALKEGARPL